MNTFNLKPAFIALTLLAATSLHSFGQQKMSLQDCLNYGRENHALNKAAGYDEQVSEYQAKEAIANYLPQITATGTLDDNLKRTTTVIPAGAFSPVDLEVQFGSQYTTNMYAQLDQVIYNQSLLDGIKAMDANKELAHLKRLKGTESISYNTAIAYYNAIIQKERVTLLEESEKNLSELLRIQRAKLDKGLVQPIDVDRIQVSYNNTVSRKESSQLSYDLALNQLKNAMGMDLNTPISIDDTLDYNALTFNTANPAHLAENTFDYQIGEQNIELQEINYKRTRSVVIPTLSAYARYGAQTYNNNFADQYDKFYDYSAIGLRLNVPIFSSLKYHSQIRQRQFELESSKQQFENNRNLLEISIANAYTSLISLQSTLDINRTNLDLARNVYQNSDLQYQKGVASLSDLLNAEYSFKEAQNNYISSLLNYVIKRLELEKSQGTLLPYLEQL